MSTDDISTDTESLASQRSVDNTNPKTQEFGNRIGRLRFLAYSFAVYFFAVVLLSITTAIASSYPKFSMLAEFIYVAIFLGMLVQFLSLIKWRLNDVNLSGWHMLWALVPIANLVLTFILLFWPGTPGENQFGSEPEKNTFLVVVVGILVLLAILNAGSNA